MELFDIRKFDEYKEDNRREVKKASGGLPHSLWETYSSFANCYGGVIILGVNEHEDGSWETTGLKDARRLIRDFWNTVNNNRKVSVNLLRDQDVASYDVNGDVILVISVPMASRMDKPVFINDNLFGGTFRRNFEGDYHCSREEVKAMLRDQTDDTYDMVVLDSAKLSDFNKETIRSYRNRHQILKSGHPFEGYTDEEYLEAIGAAAEDNDGTLRPTAAGMLMFGNEFRIIRHFPEYFLDYREVLDPTIRWTDRLQSSSGEWSGNLCDFYFRVYNKIQKDIKVPFDMVGGDRIDDTPVHKALREALANCLVNTDFFGKYGVLVKKEPNLLILENPGYIRVGKKQMIHGGKSDPRNKVLLKMFNMINIGERSGSGVPNILQTWDRENWVEPVVEETFGPDRTVLTLSFVDRTTQGTTQATQGITQANTSTNSEGVVYNLQAIELSIINLFKKHPDYSQVKAAMELGIDPNLLKYYVRKLRKRDLITREGTSQKGRWIVKI